MKASELTGRALDWAVAKAECLTIHAVSPRGVTAWLKDPLTGEDEVAVVYAPSTNWAHGGPIIGRELIGVEYDRDRVFDPGEKVERWMATKPFICDPDMVWEAYGETALIAAMRLHVETSLDDEIDIPKELL